MIQSISVSGLNGNKGAHHVLNFDPGITILTGSNGSGKTTLLRLLWYTISGNLGQVLSEFQFQSLEVSTDRIAISIDRANDEIDSPISIKSRPSKGNTLEIQLNGSPPNYHPRFAELRQHVQLHSGRSIYLPTYRRIESAFPDSSASRLFGISPSPTIGDTLTRLADDLSSPTHKLIMAISTKDIVLLLTRMYADTARRGSRHDAILSQAISGLIDAYSEAHPSGTEPQKSNALTDATVVIEQIQRKVDDTRKTIARVNAPIRSLEELISAIFRDRGIKISRTITLGRVTDAISSDRLSAGEKQMLSFLCYNASTSPTSIIIDEPETSLHVDWQRTLVPTLLSQRTKNQFILATHSPFIYAHYPEAVTRVTLDGVVHADE